MIHKTLRILPLLFLSLTLSAQENKVLMFDSIKEVLKNDQLETVESTKTKVVKQLQVEEKKFERMQYDFPVKSDFWGLVTEYWLVKNAALLKWDFKKPEYNLEGYFEKFLENNGIYEKKFKILYVNTPNVFHLALPTYDNELLFLISVPFIQSLDLTKLEISLLLYENYLRIKSDLILKKLETEEVKNLYGKNFYGQKFDQTVVSKVMTNYDTFILDKGFSFQEQFEITTQMDLLLKSDLKLWNTYLAMIKKIDELSKSNLLFKKYSKLYPSPEMQISWLLPKKSAVP